MIIKIFVSAFIVKYTKTLSVIPWSKRLTLRHGNIPVVFHTYLFTFNYCVALYFLSCENSRACLLFLNQIDIAFIFFYLMLTNVYLRSVKSYRIYFSKLKRLKMYGLKNTDTAMPSKSYKFYFPVYILHHKATHNHSFIITRPHRVFFFFFFFL